LSSKLLLDTCVFLWWQEGGERLDPRVAAAIESADLVAVSAASAWEIAIKVALGRLEIPGSVADAVRESGFIELPVGFSHAEAAGALPAHHRDPFDRMLVAQAMVERLTLVTSDQRMEPYGIDALWAERRG